ncbi:MAG: nucleoside-diphosphate kinase [Candidatus Palauibacterales bacterium]|nr:nucleoside-diphosphate kinase [Candidatus Palauibacterales bacterium]MDP2529355.1 nucleoside-diphosphate kinase [Candidatus Palauibacterales bacterium]MDP2583238.1 nucleoside-diphosphate kinase [Candidatus Palauibacterales bacterium]
MGVDRTLAIIKPDAFGSRHAGDILAHLEGEGFRVVAARVLRLTAPQARTFYAVHRGKPFYESLVAFMTSGPCMPLALEGDDAVPRLREVIGATDPSKAAEGSVRALYAESVERNAIHASDSEENARLELGFFFPEAELVDID